MKATLTVQRLLDRMRDVLQLQHIPETRGLDREITSPHVSSPGLALAGYTERFASHRLQVLGETEITYLNSLTDDDRRRVLREFFRFQVPCVFVTKGLRTPPGLVEEATFASVAVICSGCKTNDFYNRIKPWLEEEFAATTTMHASLADVFGVGLLFTGRSGIGLVDIPSIFGIRAVRQQKRIEVVVQLEDWDASATVDRTGLDQETVDILDVQLPKARVLLNPGKNITVICEVIAMNHLLKYSGVDPAAKFNERLIKQMRGASEVRRYLQEDNE